MNEQLSIPTDEMVDDYYASLMDAQVCDRLGITERAATNRGIMAIIVAELERRGELHRIEKEADDAKPARD